MSINTIATEDEFKAALNENLGVLFYFSTISCNVGEALEPKIINLLNKEFPKILYCFIDMNASPKIAAKNNVFVEPTVLIFFDGKETIRKSRHIGISELSNTISRIYKIVFD